jgi:hypothetical protein
MSKTDLLSAAAKEQALRPLIESPPNFHRWEDSDQSKPPSDNGLVNWGMRPSFLKWLVTIVHSEWTTLETGSGISTVCFAITGANHIAISPFAREHDRIRRYCANHGISTERVTFLAEPPTSALPSATAQLDLGIIDGCHAFPHPVLDYVYIDRQLKVGAILVIDDLDIPSVGTLHRFVIEDAGYELMMIDSEKTGIYRKSRPTEHRDNWSGQKMNRFYPDASYLPNRSINRRLRDALRHWRAR